MPKRLHYLLCELKKIPTSAASIHYKTLSRMNKKVKPLFHKSKAKAQAKAEAEETVEKKRASHTPKNLNHNER